MTADLSVGYETSDPLPFLNKPLVKVLELSSYPSKIQNTIGARRGENTRLGGFSACGENSSGTRAGKRPP